MVKRKGLFDSERITLWKLLGKLGFKYKQVNDKRYVYEQPRIIVQWHEYLSRMRKTEGKGDLLLTWTKYGPMHERVEKM